MPRASRSYTLETRTARGRLKQRSAPYWITIGKDLALGYRKNRKGSAWVVRLTTGARRDNGQPVYQVVTLKGVKPDDHETADGSFVLDYFQAQARAREFAKGERQKEAAGANPTTYTVGEAFDDYLRDYQARSGKQTEGLRQRYKKHIRRRFGHVRLSELSAARIRTWLNSLVQVDEQDPDRLRAQRSTANTQLTLLKAICNHAFRQGLTIEDRAWRMVRPFQNVDAPRIRFLDPEETRKLSHGCEADFRSLVQAALLTGCRYGELIRLRAEDYDAANGSIHIRYSKSGKARHIPLTDEGQAFFDRLVVDLEAEQWIFRRADGEPWRRAHQTRRMRQASAAAGINPPVSFHILRHTYGASLAKAGVPLQVIAAVLGHADTRITEKHYAHLCPNYVKDTIRANLPTVGVAEDNVVVLKTIRRDT
ncbi:tyrosine-type recombinase/integrase [Sedimenticola selenatireducens]|uniref:tyrosine-type recombinase/integrase n=1 Tax=Sedimenticola selenatireducens TaxID=191960 RepID=UPI002AAB9BF4|nr:tyrosine-type recombinase/integrase [Sedimenticola selenatireducens]